MDNELNATHSREQVQRGDQGHRWVMSSQPKVACDFQIPSRIYANISPTPSTLSSTKRGRSSGEESSTQSSFFSNDRDHQQPEGGVQSRWGSQTVSDSTTPKKSRPNTYTAPISAKPSVLTAMGTLAGSAVNNKPLWGNLPTRVPTRRRLSGGHIEQFIGECNQNMEIEPNRPRSMSF